MANEFDEDQTMGDHVGFKKDLGYMPSMPGVVGEGCEQEFLSDSVYILQGTSCGGAKACVP